MRTRTTLSLMATFLVISTLAATVFATETLEIKSRGGVLNWILGYSSFSEVREISFDAEVSGSSGWAKLEIQATATTGEEIDLKAKWIITEDWSDKGPAVFLYKGEGEAIVKIDRARTTYTLNTVRFGGYDYIILHVAGGVSWDDVFRVHSLITQFEFDD
jgi:hypothetical protein